MKKRAKKSSVRKRSARRVKAASPTNTERSVSMSSVGEPTQITKGSGFARTVVYVHGIGNKPIPSVLKCQWDSALFGFELGERSRLAYWVNRAYYPTPDPGSCGSGDKVSLEDQPTGEGISVKAHLEKVTLVDEVDAVATNKTDKKTLLAIAEAIEDKNSDEPGVSALSVDAKVLPFLPEFMRNWITRQLTRAFLRDVNDYFYVDARREVMRKSLMERLDVGGGPFVVVAHSQGSMIAYDVLCSLDPATYQVPLFVTIGSPLGIDEVEDQIRKLTGQKTLKKPACVEQWMNFADPRDPVALDPTLSGDYKPTTDIKDFSVANLDAPKNPHSGTGYLGLSVVQEAVRKVIDTSLFQRVAPFVIAKDLVRDIENDGQRRHETLIQLASADHTDVRTVEDRREQVTQILSAAAALSKVPEKDLNVDHLARYVVADLTRSETELLAVSAGNYLKSVERIWRNAAKHAYIDVSIDTLQARTAHAGYNAKGKNIEWAVLDTGIVPHPHFDAASNIVAQYDCTLLGELVPGAALDQHGHGTHVAGIIAGYMQVDVGSGEKRVLSGMAPEAKLHVYKVLDQNGHGKDAWIIKALDHIAELNDKAGDQRIQGVNLSLGSNFDPSVFGCGHSPLCNELRRLWRQGVVVVLAAGNEGFAVLQTASGTVNANMPLSIGDPANLDEAIAVGSVHKEKPHTYGVSYFSSRGPTADGRKKPDLVAPGERINSCRHDFQSGAQTMDALYVAMSGTSMAAPHVSGLVAAFLSGRREFIGYPDTVKEMLIASCVDLQRDRLQQGAGMPNLTKMLLNS
jgi:subtilisin family serine protease